MNTTRLPTPTLLGLLLLVAPSLAAAATNIVVDPASPTLTNYTSLGEWNVDGNFDGWSTGSVATASVSGGVFSGTAGGTSPILAKLNFAGGPDLDLGFNDQVELRAQVPADFTGDIQIYYGVTNTPYANGLSFKLYAEQLGGPDRISLRQNRSSGAILGEKAMRAMLEWRGRWPSASAAHQKPCARTCSRHRPFPYNGSRFARRDRAHLFARRGVCPCAT